VRYHLIELIKGNQGLDCSSLTELIIAERIGLKGDDVMFTSNNTLEEEFQKAYQMKTIVTFDSIEMIEFFEKSISDYLNEIKDINISVWDENQCFSLRFNPGDEINFNFLNKNIIGIILFYYIYKVFDFYI
jgi:diaminopimelate decarboxylase